MAIFFTIRQGPNYSLRILGCLIMQVYRVALRCLGGLKVMVGIPDEKLSRAKLLE